MSAPAVSPEKFSTLGDLLKYLRKREELTQRELALLVGYSDSEISRIEKNHSIPDAATLKALFVPALHLEQELQWVERLLELAKQARFAEIPEAGKMVAPNNLPASLTTFIGREKEQAEILQLIGTHRLVTLTGSGGVGKTRISLKVGEQVLGEYANGVWLAELAPLSDPELLPQTVASVFGIITQSTRSHTELLINFLRPKTALLILDNCEHLLDACAHLADMLLKHCPQLKILVTSREALGILGEIVYHMPSLGLPDIQQTLETFRRYESVRLFEERARLAQPDFKLTMENASSVAQWIDFIDELALRLKLVSYDTKGEYRGYTSSGPSFIENYIVVNTTNFQKFLELSPAAQEKQILDTLVHAKSLREYDDYGYNEFYKTSVLGELDSFYQWGSATGIMPTLKFPAIRQFLLNLLKDCVPNQWYSTESLIAYLKANHPYFLIPQNAPKTDRWGKTVDRYDNFHEGKDQWERDKTVPPNASDAFERVEGRYVERFLEGIPLTMRFVDVAYNPAPYKGPLPMRGMLKAFRVNERFPRLMSGKESQPRLTVQPNFDVVIESDFYPAKLIQQIGALGEEVSSPTSGHSAYVGLFKLKKTLVAAEQVRQPGLDVIALLEKLSGRALPPNVKVELEEWSGHADQFTLYEGFALLESVDEVPESDKYTVERIARTLRLVRAGEKLFSILETNALTPLRVQHPTGGFAPLAESAVSLFPKESAKEKAHRKPKQVKVRRSVAVTIRFPDDESFDSVRKTLAELLCPFQSDLKSRTISFDQQFQAKFDEAVLLLQSDFAIEVE